LFSTPTVTFSGYTKNTKQNKTNRVIKVLYIACLDISKAFDTVVRTGIFAKLYTEFGIPIILCKQIQDLYTQTYSRAKSFQNNIQSFNTTRGVMQGSVLSPILYAVFMNNLIAELQQAGISSINIQTIIHSLFYCDDIALTANSITKLSNLLKVCETYAKKWDFAFNASKCKIIKFNQNGSYLRHNKAAGSLFQECYNIHNIYYNSIACKQTKKQHENIITTEDNPDHINLWEEFATQPEKNLKNAALLNQSYITQYGSNMGYNVPLIH
jgi:hypothetical protein